MNPWIIGAGLVAVLALSKKAKANTNTSTPSPKPGETCVPGIAGGWFCYGIQANGPNKLR